MSWCRREGADICLVCHCGAGRMDEHGVMRQWRGDRCHLWEEAILLHDRARARVKQATNQKAEVDASAEGDYVRERRGCIRHSKQ